MTALAKMLYGINTRIFKQAFLSAPEMVIFFTYSLLIKDASTYKDIHHHNHHVTGKEIRHGENSTLTNQSLLGQFEER